LNLPGKYLKFEASNCNAEVIRIRRKPVSQGMSTDENFETKTKSKQVPQQRKRSKPEKEFSAQRSSKFCPTVFFPKSINLFPNLLFMCTDLRNSLISPVFIFSIISWGPASLIRRVLS